jgi:hypothetical protein
MSSHETPAPFSDEELLSLLRDEAVSLDAIVDEMRAASVEPFPTGALGAARQVLRAFDPGEAETFATLPVPLRNLIADVAIDVRAVAFLTALTRHDDKAVVKDGKRGLHLLKTRGVAVESPKPALPAAAVVSMAAAVEELPTYMSSVDGLGERVVFFSTYARMGVDVAQIVISDEEGVISAHLATLSRKEYRRFVQGLTRAPSGILAEVPRLYARSLTASSLNLNATARRPIPPNFNDLAFVLGPAVPPLPSPGRTLPPVENVSDALLGAGELLLIDVLRSWAPPEETVRALALRMEEIEVSPLYLDEAQRSDFARLTIQRAVEAFWTPERRYLWAERLFDTAYLLHEVGRRSESNWALATARAMDSGTPVELIPFCFDFFERAIEVEMQTRSALSESATKQEPSSSLILPPG